MDKYLCRKDVYDEIMLKSFGLDAESIEKARGLPDGTIREWSGKKYKKTNGKWLPVGKGKNGSTEESVENGSVKFQNGIKSVEEIISRNPGQFNEEKTKESIKKVESNIERMKKDGTSEDIVQLNQGRLKALKDHLGKLNGTNESAKHSTGDTVTLDGAKGDFKVSSIDKDGTYHVVSADGKKGYKVSENHITGNKGNAENNGSESVEDLQRQIANAKAQRSFDGDMKAAELTKKLKALQSKKDLDQKKKDTEEINFEKKNQASKTEEIARKNDAENNVNDAIKLTDAEKKEITGTFTPELQEEIKKYGRNDPTVIGNIILNNLSSTGKKDLFNKIRKQEWDYKDANNKHGNTFNSDYSNEAMYQLYQEYQKNGKESQKEDYSDWGDMSTEKKESPKKTVSSTVSAFRKQQQKKEKEKYDYNKRMNDFYVNTGLDGGPDAVLYRQAIEKEDNKQDNLKAGVRDDSIFNENDEVQFWRSGNYIDGKITQVKEDYRGAVSLQVESNGNKYWVETDNIIKHPASAK